MVHHFVIPWLFKTKGIFMIVEARGAWTVARGHSITSTKVQPCRQHSAQVYWPCIPIYSQPYTFACLYICICVLGCVLGRMLLPFFIGTTARHVQLWSASNDCCICTTGNRSVNLQEEIFMRGWASEEHLKDESTISRTCLTSVDKWILGQLTS